MKKSIKCGIAAAVLAAAGFTAYQSYSSYGVQDNSLLMQNVEALAQTSDGGDADSGLWGWWNRKDYVARPTVKTVTIHYTQWYSESKTYKCNDCIRVKDGEGQYAHCDEIPNPC